MAVKLGHKIYVAGPWVYRTYVREVAQRLEHEGHEVVSRWYNRDDAGADEYSTQAVQDLVELDQANLFVVFNAAKSEGKSFEAGYAHGRGIPTVVVGPITAPGTCIFYHLPQVTVLPTEAALVGWLKA